VAQNEVGGTALLVLGRSRFASSGNASIAAGSDSATVANPMVTPLSYVGVALTGDPGKDAGVRWVERDPGIGFTVHLNKKADSNTGFAYFIADPA
jgi:hypothetical protein